ncbi:hypothetical protein BGX23_011852 [Mortierella sp. AD031]|nr:hypothetical protein BGX23_011852 [Mortierella sp. AD031]
MSAPIKSITNNNKQRSKKPLPSSFRKLLIYIRVLILTLALVSLILDAITVSFQTNVMGLDCQDVAKQAFLILTPDLLAIFMILFLFIYPSSFCCGNSTSSRAIVVEEEYYDYDNEGSLEGSQDEGVAGGSSVTATALMAAAAERPTTAGTTRSQAQVLPAQGGNSNNDSNDSLQQQKRRNNQNTESPSYLHSRQPLSPSSSSSSRTPHSHQNLEQSRRQPHSQDHDRITTTPITTTTTTSTNTPIIITSPPQSGGIGSGTSVAESSSQEKQQQQQKQESHEGQPAQGASLAEMIAQEEIDETRRKRKRARIYTTVRVLFSLGLTILALYWPAGQFKAPTGNLNTAPTIGEHQPINGNGSYIYTPPPTPAPTSTIVSPPPPGQNINNTLNGEASRASMHEMGYYVGSRHNRKGRQREQPWCAEEESYGDDDSAAVYCRVKVIRPVVTYIWAVFLVVELCIAAMAGDFSKHGIRREHRSYDDVEEVEEGQEVAGDAEKQVQEQQQHAGSRTMTGQNDQSLAISDGAGAGTAGTPSVTHRQGRTVH